MTSAYIVTSRNAVGACFSVIYGTKRTMTNTKLNRCFVYGSIVFIYYSEDLVRELKHMR